MSITGSGNLTEKVEKGAKIHIQVKYGLITLINQEADLCDYADNVDLECPLDEGTLAISKDVDLPKEIPPVRSPLAQPTTQSPLLTYIQGKYTVLADVFTKDKDRITCLTAEVSFSRS